MDNDNEFPVVTKEMKIAGIAFSVGVFLTRAIYKHRMIPVKVVNARLQDMFTSGNVKTADGSDVMLQFFHK